MTERKPRIVFMGTPEFAVPSLRSLQKSGFDVAAVVTAPDKPAGRGRKISSSPVKQYALRNGLTLLQPERLRDPAFVKTLSDIKADIFVVVAFRMLPEEVWSIPTLGTFNLHASLLPQYRGAAPVNHAIINGETRTGVTTFLIDKEIDTGKILLAKPTDILPEENAGSLHDRLMVMGAELVVETTKRLYEGTVKPVSQKTEPGVVLNAAPKIFPADTIINWREPAVKVYNRIRGLSPYPGAVTTLRREDQSLRIKIYEGRVRDDVITIPGTIISESRANLTICCSSGAIEILSLQPEGRKRMTSAEFLRGFDTDGWEPA
jgi:methionyl-tRNA formyltransferase